MEGRIQRLKVEHKEAQELREQLKKSKAKELVLQDEQRILSWRLETVRARLRFSTDRRRKLETVLNDLMHQVFENSFCFHLKCLS